MKGVCILAKLDKTSRVKKEVKRLHTILSTIPEDKKEVAEGLIWQAARLRILLDDMWQDICDSGDTDMFTQSEKMEPYERQRPVASLYNTRDKNYQSVIKLLFDQLQTNENDDSAAELKDFLSKGRVTK